MIAGTVLSFPALVDYQSLIGRVLGCPGSGHDTDSAVRHEAGGEEDMVKQQVAVCFTGYEVVKDRAVSLALGEVVLRVPEEPLGLERGADQYIGDVMRQIVFFEVVPASAIIEIAKHDDPGGRVVL